MRRLAIFAAVCAALPMSALLMSACATPTTATTAPSASVTPDVFDPADSRVVYQVEGTSGPVSVTYATEDGIQQEELTLDCCDPVDVWESSTAPTGMALSVQMLEDGGEVTCRILIGKEVLSENTSTASFGIAQCTS